MKIYISASDRLKAIGLIHMLSKAIRGLSFIAKWPNYPNLPQTDEAKVERVNENLESIREADVVILISDYDMVPGGKFYEAGLADALNKPIFILGRTENMYMEVRRHEVAFNVEVLIGALKAYHKNWLKANPELKSKKRA